MPGFVDHLQQLKLLRAPNLNRLIKATSYKMFLIRTKRDMVDRIKVSYHFLLQGIISCYIPRFETGIAGAANQCFIIGCVNKAEDRIGVRAPFMLKLKRVQ